VAAVEPRERLLGGLGYAILERMQRASERLWWPRARWRMRGAWQWPAFMVLTPLNGVLLAELPFYGRGPGGVLPGVLVAGFLNLFCLAVLAPRAGRMLQRVRPDLPRVVAADYAGTTLLVTVTALLLVGGLLHRPVVADEDAGRRAAVLAVHDHVLARVPEYRAGLAGMDALRIERDYYRVCVPGSDPRRWHCVFADSSQRPVRLTVDPEQVPNTTWDVLGGFR
jgi:hypothetical protein